MKNKKYFLIGIVLLFIAILFFNIISRKENNKEDLIKISLRKVGHELLLTNKDSTSLVLPIKQIKNSIYQLSFQNELKIKPKELIQIVTENFKNEPLLKNYIIKVTSCNNHEIVYSYQINENIKKNFIACIGRDLPKSCYQIETIVIQNNANPLYLWFAIIISIFLFYFFRKKTIVSKTKALNTDLKIGNFIFKPSQNTLIYNQSTIPLSKKESEILSILSNNLNQVISREEITKKVWEDKGVVVSRSLDTYISKLRKKLALDSSVKIKNSHGIGYKLEIK
ncbi:MAG TPA: response regulator transcription factor [Flavobacteriia bacterium]|nr:response regulator transcription factor [Flavobacteriia bacterium]